MVNYPSDWKREKLGDCIDRYINGTSLEEFFTKNSSNRAISLGNYSEDGKYIDDGNRIVINSKTSKYLVDKDDLCMVLNDKGNGRLVGKVILIEKDNEYIINQRSLRLVINKDKVLSIFLHQLINSEVFRSKLVKYIQGNTQVYINPPSIMEIEIDIPKNRDEQKIISKALLSFDKHIENLSKLIEKKKMIRDGAVEDLVSGKKRLQGFNSEWDRYKFKKYFSKIPNNTFARDELSVKGNIGSIHYGDILTEYNTILEDKDYITFLKSEEWYSERKSLKINDVIIADTAEDETVGRVVQVGEISCPIVSGLHTIACRPNYDTAYSFLGYYMNSKCFHNQILPYITGIKVSSISKKALDELELVIPKDIKEQEAIANILSSMDKEIENLEKEKEKYIQLKSGAMDDLLTGKIRLV